MEFLQKKLNEQDLKHIVIDVIEKFQVLEVFSIPRVDVEQYMSVCVDDAFYRLKKSDSCEFMLSSSLNLLEDMAYDRFGVYADYPETDDYWGDMARYIIERLKQVLNSDN